MREATLLVCVVILMIVFVHNYGDGYMSRTNAANLKAVQAQLDSVRVQLDRIENKVDNPPWWR